LRNQFTARILAVQLKPAATAMNTLSEADILEGTRHWLEQVVIGLNLCPFARHPWTRGRVHIEVTAAESTEQLAEALVEAILTLDNSQPEERETTLLVHPRVLNDFSEYNNFLDTADALLEALGLDGVFQVASFHPDYRFADTSADDPANCSNRSPWPTLHLIREASIEAAISGELSSERIYQRNIAVLQQLGMAGWRKLMPPGTIDQ
jgi:uncharacterized protein